MPLLFGLTTVCPPQIVWFNYALFIGSKYTCWILLQYFLFCLVSVVLLNTFLLTNFWCNNFCFIVRPPFTLGRFSTFYDLFMRRNSESWTLPYELSSALWAPFAKNLLLFLEVVSVSSNGALMSSFWVSCLFVTTADRLLLTELLFLYFNLNFYLWAALEILRDLFAASFWDFWSMTCIKEPDRFLWRPNLFSSDFLFLSILEMF